MLLLSKANFNSKCNIISFFQNSHLAMNIIVGQAQTNSRYNYLTHNLIQHQFDILIQFILHSFLKLIHYNLSLSLTFQLSHTPTNINNKKESKHGSECNTKTWCCEMGFRSLFLYPNNKSCAVRVRVSTQSLLTQCKI